MATLYLETTSLGIQAAIRSVTEVVIPPLLLLGFYVESAGPPGSRQ